MDFIYKNRQNSGVVAYKPGNYIFPKNEVPAPLPIRTGTLTGVTVSSDDFAKLTRIPIVIYFGDYITEVNDISEDLGAENWRVRLELARHFVATISKYGGNAKLVELPKIGIYGNTHFIFAEKNNVELADHLSDWMKQNGLDKI